MNLSHMVLRRPVWSMLANRIPMAAAGPSLTVTRTITKHRVRVLKEMNDRSKSFDLAAHKQRPRSEWADWNYSAELFAFNKRLSENFNETSLQIAFTHKSYVNVEMKRREQLGLSNEGFLIENNELFIQQGEQQLNSFLPKYLRHFLPQVPEEGIQCITKYLLSNGVLAQVASSIGCKDLILTEEFPVTEITKANTFKALVGACLKDNGQGHANNFIIDFLSTFVQKFDLFDIWTIDSPETVLQAILNNSQMQAAEPRVLRETGIKTITPLYLIGFYSNRQLLGTGPGASIEEAKEMAAYDSLRRIFRLTNAQTLFKYGKDAYALNYEASASPAPSIQNWRISLNVNEPSQDRFSVSN